MQTHSVDIVSGHWVTGNFVVTVRLTSTGSGYSSEWWVSSNFDGNLQVIGNYNFPIYGYSSDEALRKAAFHVETLCTFALASYGGESDMVVHPARDYRVEVATTHIVLHREAGVFDDMTLLDRTRSMLNLARQFGVSKRSLLVARIEGVNVRTVHERVQRIRALK